MLSITVLVLLSKHNPNIHINIRRIAESGANISIVVNGFNSGTAFFLSMLQMDFPLVKTFTLDEPLKKCDARNYAVSVVDTDIIYWIDDDAYFAGDNITLLQNLFKKYPDVSIIGGPNLTPLESSNEFERLQGIALESEFVSGEMTYRYKSAGDNSVTSDSRLILCNMAFRREVFTSSGLTFETKLFYAEENLLITQAINLGLTALYCPDLIVYHSRRQDFLGLIQQFFNSGYGRGLLPAFSKGTLQWYHLAPAALVVYICISFYIVNLFLFLPPILYYTLNSYPISKKNGGRISGTFKIAFIAFTIHFAYGTGIIFATIKRLIWKIQKKFS